MKLSSVNPFLIRQLLAVACAASSAYAVDRNWLGGTANWTTTTNWSPNDVPNTSAERAVFDNNVGLNAVTYANMTPSPLLIFGGVLVKAGQISGLSINPETAGAIFRLAGGSAIEIEFGAGAFSIGTSGTSQIFGGSAGNLTFNNNSASTATIGSGALLYSNSAGTVMQFIGSGDWAVNSVIQGVANVSLLKDGVGTTTLSNANTYEGTTTVNGGTLKLTNSLALQNSSFSGGTGSLVFDSSVATHAFTFGSLNASTGLVLEDNAGVPNAVALTIGNNTAAATYSGNLSGAGSLTKVGAGTQILSGTNAYSGATAVNVGTLQFANRSALYNATPASWTAANLTVASGATAAFNVGGAGEFDATDVGNLIALTNVANGAPATLGFKSGSRIGLDTTNAAGGVFTYGNAITDHIAGVTTDTLGLVKLGTGTLKLTGTNSYTGTTTITAGTLEFSSAANQALSGAISGAGALTKSGGGILTLTGANGYTGATSVDAGELAITGGGSISSSSAISIATNATFRESSTFAQTFGAISGSGAFIRDTTNTGTKTFSGSLSGFSGTMTFNNGLNFFTSSSLGSANAAFVSGSGNVGEIVFATGNYTLNFGSLSGGGNFRTQNAAGSGTVTASIGGLNTDTTFSGGMGQVTSALAITKVGTGTLTLSGTNAYTGKTSVNAGTLQFAKKASLYNGATPTATNLTVASGATLALNVGGTGEFAVADVNALQSSTFWTAANTATTGLQAGAKIGFDTTNATGGTFTQGNLIANSGGTNGGAIGVTKLGTGTLVLDKANTYTGATTVSAGTLLVNGSLGNTAVAVNAGTLGGTGSIAGSVTVGSATLTAGASAGSLEIAGNLALADGSTTTIEIAGTSFTLNGTEQYDRIKLTGATPTVGLDGTLTISDLTTFAANQAFGIIQMEAGAVISGTFNGLAEDALVGTFDGQALYITYAGNFGDSGSVATFGGNDVVLYTIPEPNVAALLGGVGILALLRRRRN